MKQLMTKTCEVCGKEFQCGVAAKGRGCSPSCRRKILYPTGPEMVTINCAYCGKPKVMMRSRVDYYTRIGRSLFCNHRCSASRKKGKYKKRENAAKEKTYDWGW